VPRVVPRNQVSLIVSHEFVKEPKVPRLFDLLIVKGDFFLVSFLLFLDVVEVARDRRQQTIVVVSDGCVFVQTHVLDVAQGDAPLLLLSVVAQEVELV